MSIKVGDKVRVGNFIRACNEDDPSGMVVYEYDEAYVPCMLLTIGRVGTVKRIDDECQMAEVVGVDPTIRGGWNYLLTDLEAVKL